MQKQNLINNINIRGGYNDYNNDLVLKEEKIENDYYEENQEYENEPHLNEENYEEEHKQEGNEDYLYTYPSWKYIFK